MAAHPCSVVRSQELEQLYDVAPVLPLTCETLNQIILIGS